MQVDIYAPLESQSEMMSTAVDLASAAASARGLQSAPELKLPNLTTIIPFNTERHSPYSGMALSLAYYWQLVGEGTIVREDGLTDEQMQSRACSHAGARASSRAPRRSSRMSRCLLPPCLALRRAPSSHQRSVCAASCLVAQAASQALRTGCSTAPRRR